MHGTLPPSDEVLMKFIKNPEEHKHITGSDLIDGTYKNINVESLVDYYIDNKRKYSLTELEQAISKTLFEVSINEDNTESLFLASVLLCDSDDEKLSSISKKTWNLFINMTGMDIPT